MAIGPFVLRKHKAWRTLPTGSSPESRVATA